MGGGQMHHSNAAVTAAMYDHPGNGAPSGSDAGDAVMARWLQSAGLQHLASPLSTTSMDHRVLPNHHMQQGYGAQSTEEKQRVFKLMRNLNFNGETGSESSPSQSSRGFAASDGLYSSEFRGDFGAGLLDLHSLDDTELLSEHVIPEPFESSPFMPAVTERFESDFDVLTSKQKKGETYSDVPSSLLANERDNSARESNVAKIKVVVRKRPLNKKEIARKEDDIVTVNEDACLSVHEPKLKVDLTAYVEKHEFCFDAVLDEQVTNDEVYRVTVEPIIPTVFQRTKATCFAYGQTGSGKTYTMQPLPLRASADLIRLLHQPVYRSQRFKLWLSFFEIYGGKLYDLLSDRKKLLMREDGRQQVCIVGLQEFEVSDVQIVKEFIVKGNAARSTGSTGANEESSRSHAILQLVVKKHNNEIKESRRNNDANDSKGGGGKVVGKISFIDLAGSERGADTTDNDRQTRIEGAEINKSLLALKECIRALDNDQIHIPFRGSKLTEVLRDSFVGNSRTVMISCISPNAGSCEHTLNTLRYADRVKSLSKTGNSKKEPFSMPSSSMIEMEDVDQHQDSKFLDPGKRVVGKDLSSYNDSMEFSRPPLSFASNHTSIAQEESMATTATETRNFFSSSTNRKISSTQFYQSTADSEEKNKKFSPPRRRPDKQQYMTQTNADSEEKLQKAASPLRRRAYMDDRSEKLGGNWDKKDGPGSDLPTSSYKQQYMAQTSAAGDTEEKLQKASPLRRRAYMEERSERLGGNWEKKDGPGSDLRTISYKPQSTSVAADAEKEVQKVFPPPQRSYRDGTSSNLPPTGSYKQKSLNSASTNNTGFKHNETESPHDANSIDETLEEEEALIAAHRKEVEDTMETVREEMKLLAEVDKPGSVIDNYVTQLSFVLSRKAASLVSLQARLARFQHRLKEQEILSRKRTYR